MTDIAGDVELTFGDDVGEALGLTQGSHVSETQHVPRLCNMFFGLSYLFVYTKLVPGRLVGDTQSPLLRAIPVYGSYGDAHMNSGTYTTPSLQHTTMMWSRLL